MTVTQNIKIYGAEIWADALKIKKYRKRMTGVQHRGALRVACTYRAASEPTTLTVAGIIPIDLLASERKEIHDGMSSAEKQTVKAEARKFTMERWQERWADDTRGR